MNSALAAIVALGVAGLAQTGSLVGTLSEHEPETYTNTAQHTLVNPSVVRVLHQLRGEVVVEPVRFDITTMRVIADPDSAEEENFTLPIDETMSGTGFVVSEEGVIITNAHVVSSDMFRLAAVVELLPLLVVGELERLVARYGLTHPKVKEFAEKLEEYYENAEQDEAEEFVVSMLDFVTFEDEHGSSSVVVLPQGATADSKKDLINKGNKVEVRTIPDDWLRTGEDVALLTLVAPFEKIPAVALASREELGVNVPIAAYGFPGSTDMGTSTVTSVTVTQGNIISVKQLPNKTIRAYQIDAKISKGSSGGPLVDVAGRVVGIVTLETGTEDGDNYGFALPVSVVYDLLESVSIEGLTTNYQAHVRTGLALQEQRHCKSAIESYEKGLSVIEVGDVHRKELSERVSECYALIASGGSIDTPIDEFMEKLYAVDSMIWVLTGSGFVVMIILISGGLFLRRQLRLNRAHINELEEELEEQDAEQDVIAAAVASNTQALPGTSAPPHVDAAQSVQVSEVPAMQAPTPPPPPQTQAQPAPVTAEALPAQPVSEGSLEPQALDNTAVSSAEVEQYVSQQRAASLEQVPQVQPEVPVPVASPTSIPQQQSSEPQSAQQTESLTQPLTEQQDSVDMPQPNPDNTSVGNQGGWYVNDKKSE